MPATATPASVTAGTKIIEMSLGKECKGSLRYETPDGMVPKPVATNIYISKEWARNMPARVRVTIEPLP